MTRVERAVHARNDAGHPACQPGTCTGATSGGRADGAAPRAGSPSLGPLDHEGDGDQGPGEWAGHRAGKGERTTRADDHLGSSCARPRPGELPGLVPARPCPGRGIGSRSLARATYAALTRSGRTALTRPRGGAVGSTGDGCSARSCRPARTPAGRTRPGARGGRRQPGRGPGPDDLRLAGRGRHATSSSSSETSRCSITTASTSPPSTRPSSGSTPAPTAPAPACGQPIAPERLEALPWTALCIDCSRTDPPPMTGEQPAAAPRRARRDPRRRRHPARGRRPHATGPLRPPRAPPLAQGRVPPADRGVQAARAPTSRPHR